MQFARRRKSLRTINEQYGIKAERNSLLDMLNPDEDYDITSNFYANFYRYQSIDDISSRLNDGWPLCGFHSRETYNSVYVAYGNSRSQVNFVRIDIDRHKRPSSCCGLDYFPIKIDPCLVGPFNKKDLKEMIDGFCLLLPYFIIAEKESVSKKYTLVTDTWEVLADEDMFSLSCSPQISETVFEKILKLNN